MIHDSSDTDSHAIDLPISCQLNALCNGALCPLHNEGMCAYGQSLIALESVGGTKSQCGVDASHTKEWRCYAENNTHDSAYKNGCCYCSRQKQLSHALCLCKNGGNASKCGGVTPTPAPPEPPAPGVTLFRGGEAPGYGWYFFPRLVQTSRGELLVFSEAHKVCGHGSDKGWIDIVMKRSVDGGLTWSPVQVVLASCVTLARKRRSISTTTCSHPSIHAFSPYSHTAIIIAISTIIARRWSILSMRPNLALGSATPRHSSTATRRPCGC